MLRIGSRGPEVHAWQKRLAADGFDPGPVDGIYGARTAQATRAWQASRGVTADGVVGPQTRAMAERRVTIVRTMPEPGPMARLVVEFARRIEGWQAGDPATRPQFEALLGPAPNGARWPLDVPYRYDGTRTHGVSTCAMVAVGVLRELGLWRDPYHPGDGLDPVIAHARKCGAWVEPPRGRVPPGAIFQVVGPMHVGIAIRWDGDILESIDGGQVGKKRLQAIKRRRRWWDGRRLGGRVLRGWVDMDRWG